MKQNWQCICGIEIWIINIYEYGIYGTPFSENENSMNEWINIIIKHTTHTHTQLEYFFINNSIEIWVFDDDDDDESDEWINE